MMILYFLVGFFVLVLIWFVWWFPKKQTSKYDYEKGKKWEVENEFRKTIIQLFGGLVVIAGLLFAYQELRNFHISQKNLKEGQIASRFSQSIKLLGENNPTQKIGGIYALEQITRESPENYLGTIIEVLSAFVRGSDYVESSKKNGEKKRNKDKKSEKTKEEKGKSEHYNKLKPEIQIAMTVLGRIRKDEYKPYWEKLPPINLSNAKLAKANLVGAILREANLKGANLRGAILVGAILREANLKRAILKKADLRVAKLQGALLTEAYLQGANLKGAYLQGANLQGAFFQGADLDGAFLRGANLKEADLTGAKPLTTEQLLTVKTLCKVKGLPPEMEKKLRADKPELFELPKTKIEFPKAIRLIE